MAETKVTIKLEGAALLANDMRVAREVALPVVLRRLDTLGRRARDNLKRRTPRSATRPRDGKRIGDLWTVTMPRASGGGAATVEVVNPSPVAAYLSEGTAPHTITARPGGVLAFEAGGQTVFATQVQHPGTRPNPFIAKAVEDSQKDIDAFVDDVLRELLGT